jgi:inorganic pyrophosphatase
VIRCRAIGVLTMEDESGIDAKVLAVPVDKICPQYKDIKSYKDIPEFQLAPIAHFFEHYKDLEKGKWVKVGEWKGVEEANAEIVASVARAK